MNEFVRPLGGIFVGLDACCIGHFTQQPMRTRKHFRPAIESLQRRPVFGESRSIGRVQCVAYAQAQQFIAL